MSKVWAWAGGTAVAMATLLSTGAAALPVGPHAAVCARGTEPAMLVHVTGFSERRGMVRVQSYGGDPARWFDKGSWLQRIEVAVPARGSLDVCVPVAGPGSYAVSVRHDVDGDGKSTRADGGGMSGNPHLGITDLLFKRKPDPDQVAVRVAHGVVTVPVVLNYLQGTSFRPVGAAGR